MVPEATDQASNTMSGDSRPDDLGSHTEPNETARGANPMRSAQEQRQPPPAMGDREVDDALKHYAPASPPARPQFADELRTRFLAGMAEAEPAPRRSMARRLTEAITGVMGGPMPLIAAGAAAVVLLLVLVLPGDGPLATLGWGNVPAVSERSSSDAAGQAFPHGGSDGLGLTSPGQPDASQGGAITRAELVALNREAWQGIGSLAGTFESDTLGLVEEWVAMPAGSAPRYRRVALPEGQEQTDGTWKISDGETEWEVDGDTGRVVEEAPAPIAVEDAPLNGERMLCAGLELPPDLGQGSEPVLQRAHGRLAYALDGVEAATGEPRTYWLDEADHLVFLVTDSDGDAVWRRGDLIVNPVLADADFRPDNLARLGS